MFSNKGISDWILLLSQKSNAEIYLF